jgi:hypothetical protein
MRSFFVAAGEAAVSEDEACRYIDVFFSRVEIADRGPCSVGIAVVLTGSAVARRASLRCDGFGVVLAI